MEDALKRARTPKQRRRVERKMKKLHEEIQKIEFRKKVIDIAYERWVRHLERGES